MNVLPIWGCVCVCVFANADRSLTKAHMDEDGDDPPPPQLFETDAKVTSGNLNLIFMTPTGSFCFVFH